MCGPGTPRTGRRMKCQQRGSNGHADVKPRIACSQAARATHICTHAHMQHPVYAAFDPGAPAAHLVVDHSISVHIYVLQNLRKGRRLASHWSAGMAHAAPAAVQRPWQDAHRLGAQLDLMLAWRRSTADATPAVQSLSWAPCLTCDLLACFLLLTALLN